jgi:3-phenylpropionate/trans-cinnamate dioxygenase ferredoxin reductase subunit
VVRGSIDDGEFSVFYLRDGRVAACLAVGRSGDIEHAGRLITSGAEVGPRADELADLSTDLSAL